MLFLIRIHRLSDVNQKDLTETFFLTKGYVAKSIKDLENKGFIIRTKNSKDKRKNNMELTQKSLDLIPKFEKINLEWERKMGLDEVDENFFRIFKKLTDKSIEINEEAN